MNYKLGIILLEPKAVQGGTSTFSETMRDYLSSTQLDNDVKLILNTADRNCLKRSKDKEIIYLNLRYRDNICVILYRFISNKLKNILKPNHKPTLFETYSEVISDKLRKTGCSLFWFVTPPPFVVNLASVSPIYNLAHLEFPWISEFARNNEWQSREEYFRLLIEKSYKIIFTDSHHAEIARQHYNISENKILIKSLPMPTINSDLSQNALDATLSRFDLLGTPYFIYPANFWEHKNHHFLIEIVVKIMQKNSRLKLIFTGSDPSNYLKYIAKSIEECDYPDRIKILNFVNRNELIQLMKGSKSVVFPSLITPDSIPELEAKYLKVPFIKGTFKYKSHYIENNSISIPFSRRDLWVEILQNILNEELPRELNFEGKNVYPREYFHEIREIAQQFTNGYFSHPPKH